MAGFHAAQALISERIGQIAKSHSGVRSTFARLVKDDPQVDRALVRFLGRAYRFKEIRRLRHRPSGGGNRFRSTGGAADVAGYSRLMGVDEEGPLERFKALCRELLDPSLT